MSKHEYQATIPDMFKRKRKRDAKQRESNDGARQSSSEKRSRRSLALSKSAPEVITLDSDEAEFLRPDTPEESPDKSMDTLAEATFSRFRNLSTFSKTSALKSSPLPSLKWADRRILWRSLVKTDAESGLQRGREMFTRNPELQPRMRSILLDWLIEVADVYKLHRETYYLAQDYIDRALMVRENTPKQDLQLLGISCLFLAAKVEEIYPPKVSEFAYVTDGACSEDSIREHEMFVAKELDWQLCPMTPMSWLSFYLQVASQNNAERPCRTDFEYPRFPSASLPLCAKLLDLATLDTGCVDFPYSVLAASALAIIYGKRTATESSGLGWKDIRPCVVWMAPFAVAITSGIDDEDENDENSIHLSLEEELRNKPDLFAQLTPNVDDKHNLQNHVVSMELLELGQSIRPEDTYAYEAPLEDPDLVDLQTPDNKPIEQQPPEGILTPPDSLSKPVLSDVTSKTTNTTSTGLRPTELFSSTDTRT